MRSTRLTLFFFKLLPVLQKKEKARTLSVGYDITYISGLCIFLPDGELYTGTVSNFQGNEPVIYKSLGQGAALKTENSLKWLQGELHLHFKFGGQMTCGTY